MISNPYAWSKRHVNMSMACKCEGSVSLVNAQGKHGEHGFESVH